MMVTRMGQNWNHQLPKIQRAVEAYSEWGNSEDIGCLRPFKMPADYLK